MSEVTVLDRRLVESLSAEEMSERVRSFSREALAELADRREKSYALTCADFAEELAVLTREGDTLESEIQTARELMEAKARLTRFESDRLIVAGKPEQAKTELGKLEQSKRELARIEGRRGEIAQRVREIESEKTAALRSGAESFRESSVTLIRACEGALSHALDLTKSTLNLLELKTGGSLYEPSSLTAGEKTSEWFVLNKSYRGRG